MCNLASIALNRFVTSGRDFDFKALFEVTKVSLPQTTYGTVEQSLPCSHVGCDTQFEQDH